jgi:hypothetical protein
LFEVEGGSDKWLSGRRKDTLPIVRALQARGVEADILVYRPEWVNELNLHMVGHYDAYISRVNPGNIPGGDADYLRFLRGLSDAGIMGMSHPDDMMRLGAKDVLTKLAGTGLVPDDTYAYYDFESLWTSLPLTLAGGDRVLKQNRGSTGEGIWHIEVIDGRDLATDEPLPLDTRVKCTEAVDNHVEEHSLQEFMAMCVQYVIGEDGMVVDMKFMPRIVEGEIRILLVGEKPVFVVHKKPAEQEGAFSATLFSGAKYTYEEPEQWQGLIDHFMQAYPTVRSRLGDFQTPLIWTADFMLDTDEHGNDSYVLGEFNCSCVGFTSHLDRGIQDMIAEEVIAQLKAREASEKGSGFDASEIAEINVASGRRSDQRSDE